MKKSSYVLFGLVLVVLILAFNFPSSYLSSLEQSAKGTGQPDGKPRDP